MTFLYVLQSAGSRRASARRNLADEDPLGGSYKHEGCFKDLEDDRVFGDKITSDSMTAMVSVVIKASHSGHGYTDVELQY